jgi:hypothetical protein
VVPGDVLALEVALDATLRIALLSALEIALDVLVTGFLGSSPAPTLTLSLATEPVSAAAPSNAGDALGTAAATAAATAAEVPLSMPEAPSAIDIVARARAGVRAIRCCRTCSTFATVPLPERKNDDSDDAVVEVAVAVDTADADNKEAGVTILLLAVEVNDG